MGILDLPGPQFLVLFVGLVIAGAVGTRMLQARLRAPDGLPSPRDMKELSPVEIAYLAGGELQATRAAIASLAKRQLLVIDPEKRTFRALAPATVELDTFERSVYLAIGEVGSRFDRIKEVASSSLAQVRQTLRERRFLVDSREYEKARSIPFMVLGVVAVLGFAKLLLGAERGPVTVLGFLIVATVALMAYLASNVHERSPLGDRALDSLKLRNAALRDTATTNATRISPEDFAIAVALFGGVVLTAAPYADLGRAMLPRPDARSQQSSSGCSSCGSSWGSGCGGGDGGGCGGCGGD